MITLGTKLTRLRKKKGYTQQEIADLLHISQPAYHKWETDLTRPAADNLLKISEIYEIDIKDLLEEAPTFNITNSDCSIQNIGNSNFYAESPDLINGLLKNQDAITNLLNVQNKLIETLINKIKE
ncbi:helix-turn-helix transcriptional regulator [Pedobacter sp. ISL-68]|uniref:helix-turn-helix domain-containing protein n=1 Tax=unclassified Pedobacter TaxID=2628915 RepID=UPI001BE866B4|nr:MULTISPECIES: helix-turn-helix transcriptional regulator [unclassified Pedobacter]MBT2559824.1 helix-turn-helix transcriptional regulator [Pedobacter sp. ISL-64]MBT2592129.1 helix-turn-helix transcriptional regulator [Pedobacter sp. ISL-68]